MLSEIWNNIAATGVCFWLPVFGKNAANKLLVQGLSTENRTYIEYAILNGADLNQNITLPQFETEGAKSPLHWLLSKFHDSLEDTDLALLAIENGANIHTQDPYGNTPLLLATLYGKTPVVIKLKQMGANIMTANYSGISPLRAVPSQNNVDIFLILTQNIPPQQLGPLLLDKPNPNALSALETAVLNGQCGIVSYILSLPGINTHPQLAAQLSVGQNKLFYQSILQNQCPLLEQLLTMPEIVKPIARQAQSSYLLYDAFLPAQAQIKVLLRQAFPNLQLDPLSPPPNLRFVHDFDVNSNCRTSSFEINLPQSAHLHHRRPVVPLSPTGNYKSSL